jgi:hypothetical protein
MYVIGVPIMPIFTNLLLIMKIPVVVVVPSRKKAPASPSFTLAKGDEH